METDECWCENKIALKLFHLLNIGRESSTNSRVLGQDTSLLLKSHVSIPLSSSLFSCFALFWAGEPYPRWWQAGCLKHEIWVLSTFCVFFFSSLFLQLCAERDF